MKPDTYLESLENEGFGLVEDVKVIYESEILTTVEVTKDIAINLYKDREGNVYDSVVYASMIKEDEVHYRDVARVVDIVTRLTTDLSRTDRERIYDLLSKEEEVCYIGIGNNHIEQKISEEEGMITYTVHSG